MLKKFFLILISVLVFAGCGKVAFEDDGKIHAVSTVGMLGDTIKNVGGDFVTVKSIMGPGVDPHLYKPSGGDIGLMEEADVIFYVGLHLEGKMVEIFESLAEKKEVIAVAGSIDGLLTTPNGAVDPHIWFDVDLWSKTIDNVEKTFSKLDPKNSDVYAANAAAYLAELSELHEWVLAEALKVPEDQRVMITAHDAFNYFGRAYGFEVKGLQGISTASDYGLKDLEEMINLIVERKLKAVFVESSVPRKSIEALQQGVIAKGWDVEIGGELFSDAMGDPTTPEGNYLGMVRHNVNTIVNALK